jgi:hypothetical protein
MAFPVIGARNRNGPRTSDSSICIQASKRASETSALNWARSAGLSLELKRRSQMMASPHLRTIIFDALTVTLLGFYPPVFGQKRSVQDVMPLQLISGFGHRLYRTAGSLLQSSLST